jgi:hypothetical protein
MLVTTERFESGWHGISISLRPEEVIALIERLGELNEGFLGHFHIRRNSWSGDPGVADIEISLSGPSDQENMCLE